MSDKLTTSLQESVLTLIATNDEQGRIAAGLLKPDFFDANYKDIATRVLGYIREHHKVPGKAHLDDLLDDVISDDKHKKRQQYLMILEGIFTNADSLNADYVLSRVHEFARLQSLKSAWFGSADILKTGGRGSVEEVEQLWYSALRTNAPEMDAGVFLSDRSRALQFLDRPREAYLTGIKPLDRVHCGPTPGTILLFIAPKGSGKSWFCIHCARQCLMQRARVVHISLEMGIPEVIQRYYQSMFAIPKRDEPYDVTNFELGQFGMLGSIKREEINPKISLSDPNVRKYLNKHIKQWGAQFDRLVVQEFAPNTLTIAQLDAYLDMLEVQHKFIPNVLVVDYPDLMHIRKSENLRLEISRLYVELRGLLKRRNLAGLCPTQGNRLSWDATTVKASHVAEDAGKLMIADMALTFSQTEEEKALGLARLFLDKNRNDEDGFTVVISQSYVSGQFVIDSARMPPPKHYWDMIPKKRKASEREEDEE